MNNYRSDVFSVMSHSELVRCIPITPSLIEILELNRMGAIRNTSDGANGVDGFDSTTGRPIEIKSQIYVGNQKLDGRGKYSVRNTLVERKKLENEKIHIIGADGETADVYYRFSFDFAAISAKYEEVANKHYDTYNVLPCHYMSHRSFEVVSVASPDTLQQNKHKFTGKFFNIVMEMSTS